MYIHIELAFQKDQDWKFDQYILQWIFYNFIKALNKKHAQKFGVFVFSNIFFEKDKYKSGNTYN